MGNSIIKTPHLDRLVAEGTAFRRAYSPTPVCGPARQAIATGSAPHICRKVDNLQTLRTDLPTYPGLLRKDGYQSVLYGVAHHHLATKTVFDDVRSHKTDYPQWFREQGIDHVIQTHGRTSEYYYLPQVLPYPEHFSTPHWIADHGIRFLKERDKNRPFMMGLHFGKPHPPWAVPFPWHYLYRGSEMPYPIRPANYRDYQCRANRYQNRYKWMEDACRGDDFLLRTIRAAYYAMISYVDSQIGRVFEALGEEIDNTLIIFSCDHGEMLGDYGCVGKRCMLEASVRVPLIARLPDFIPEGHECRAAAGTIDIMPTILDAAGIPAPSTCEEGKSLREVADMEPGERVVFSQLSRLWNGQYFAADGIGSYIYSAGDKREWYFNIQDELDQGPILSLDERGQKLRNALFERHRNDTFSEAVENGNWRDHYVPANRLERDPDYGLLFAEPAEEIQAAVDSLGKGYARNVTGLMNGHPMAEHLMWFTEEEANKWRR